MTKVIRIVYVSYSYKETYESAILRFCRYLDIHIEQLNLKDKNFFKCSTVRLRFETISQI